MVAGCATGNYFDLRERDLVLADRVNQGYHDVEMLVVDRVQGRNIRHLKDLIRIVESAEDEFLRFQGSDGQIIVLEREQVEKRNRSILRRYGVPFDRSENLRKKASEMQTD
jgi:hypothetical protein